MKHLQRTYLFSDTFGAPAASPLDRPDPDALISTDFRSQRRTDVHREFDIYHDADQTAHLLRMLCDLDTQVVDTCQSGFREQYLNSATGVFINVAPRTVRGKNGNAFYIATAREGRIRVVTTPIDALAPIRDEIETLERLPNTDNGLYPNGEQFRSSYTPVLLHEDHGYRTIDHGGNGDIPTFREDSHIAYVDRFGNVITHSGNSERQRIEGTLRDSRGNIYLSLNGKEHGPYQTASNLGDAIPGATSVYVNGNVDIARKWQDGETPSERLQKSVYIQLDQPAVGTPIEVSTNEFATNNVE